VKGRKSLESFRAIRAKAEPNYAMVVVVSRATDQPRSFRSVNETDRRVMT
jgi:hypothetical protein